MRVLVLAEYYPRAADPVRGIWTHRQTVAARNAGIELRVLVLHRPLPPLAALRRGDLRAIAGALAQPARAELERIEIEYLRYVSPPRPWSYSTWGAWAAPALALSLRRLRRRFPFDLVHAHYAVPAGDAIRRAAPSARLVISVHGHDVYGELAGRRSVHAALAHADLVLANSEGTARRSAACGARATRVVRLGTDIPLAPRQAPSIPTLVTVGHLAARKRHADVISAVARLRSSHPELRYVIVGDGPERARLQALARSLGVAQMIEFRGQLSHEVALAAARSATLFVMPSVDEAFGVAYVEAMAAGVPAIACEGEDGPQEIASAGGGISLVPPGDVTTLTRQIEELIRDSSKRASQEHAARENAERNFTWRATGEATARAYRDVLSVSGPTLGGRHR